ncbi:hypothetical protein ACIQ6V_31490, partial [Streptomyces sp. NPDC096198]|uniref:hypothetical protein n=1 Tax=Streptomyces sp. NPDC096198 TaxID=3366080 RepID=UPI00380D34AA
YSPERLSQAFLRALPFGVSDSIRPFLDPISSALSRFPLSRFPFRLSRLYQKFWGRLTGVHF